VDQLKKPVLIRVSIALLHLADRLAEHMPANGFIDDTGQIPFLAAHAGEEAAQGSQESHSGQDQTAKAHGQLLVDLYNELRELGLSGQIDAFHAYVAERFGCGVRDLSAEQIKEIMTNLDKCRKDASLLERFRSYLSNFQQAA